MFQVKSKATEDKKHQSVLDSILHFESHKSFPDFTVPETDIVCNFRVMFFTSFSIKFNFSKLKSSNLSFKSFLNHSRWISQERNLLCKTGRLILSAILYPCKQQKFYPNVARYFKTGKCLILLGKNRTTDRI